MVQRLACTHLYTQARIQTPMHAYLHDGARMRLDCPYVYTHLHTTPTVCNQHLFARFKELLVATAQNA